MGIGARKECVEGWYPGLSNFVKLFDTIEKNKIIHKFTISVFLRLLTATLKIAQCYKLYKFISFLLYRLIRWNTMYWKAKYCINPNKEKNLTILAFNRETFWKDLIELDSRTDLNMIYFPNFLLAAFADVILPGKFRSQVAYHINENKIFTSRWIIAEAGNNLYREPESTKIKEAYNRAVESVLLPLQKKLGFNSILTSNVQYYQDQGWINGCKLHNIPFLALCKEGKVSEQLFHEQILVFKELEFRFHGYKVAVFSEGAKEILVRSNVAEANNVVVTGCPRTDKLFDISRVGQSYNDHIGEKNDKKWIVLFDFYEYNGLPDYPPKLWRETIQSFLEAANQSSNSKMGRRKSIFIIKTKSLHYSNKLKYYLSQNLINSKNILISHDIELEDIFYNSRVICGYISTILVKFMCTDIPMIIVNWAEAFERPSENMFVVPTSKAYEMVTSTNEFMVALKKYWTHNKVENDEDSTTFREDREKIIFEHLFKIDGERSMAVANFVKNSLSEFHFKE
jgi:hypothetical protein